MPLIFTFMIIVFQQLTAPNDIEFVDPVGMLRKNKITIRNLKQFKTDG